MQLWICTYDVSDDKARQLIAKALLNYGKRVQYSVFELHITPTQKQKLHQQLLPHIEKSDSIRWYPLCKSCQRNFAYYGTGQDIQNTDYFII